MAPLDALYNWNTPWKDSPSDVQQIFTHLPMRMLEVKTPEGWRDHETWKPCSTYRLKKKRQHNTKHKIYSNWMGLWYYDDKNVSQPLSMNTSCVGIIYYHPERDKYYYSKDGNFQVAEKDG